MQFLMGIENSYNLRNAILRASIKLREIVISRPHNDTARTRLRGKIANMHIFK